MILISTSIVIHVYLNTPYVNSVGREVYDFQWYLENKFEFETEMKQHGIYQMAQTAHNFILKFPV